MKLVFGLYLFAAVLCFADTPPPGALYVKGGTDGTKIGNTGDSLKVTVTGGGGTVNQGTGGLSPWLVNINNASLPVTQSGSWSVTASQGAPPWSFNLSQYLGSSVSVTNPIASRISNGTSFVDPTQIRALTSSDQVTTIQGTSPWIINGTVTANAGTGTFQTNILNASIPVTQSGTWTNTVTQTTAANLNATVVTTAGATIAKDSSLTTINSTLGSPFQAGGSIGNTTFGATQSGSWTTGRTWNLSSGSDSVAITGSVTASNASIGANGSSAPASSTQVGGSDGTNLQPLQVDGSKNLKVVVQNTVPVTGTFFQATQPVSIAAPVAVTGTFFQATQPVSGTVTANAGSGTFLVDGSAHTQPVSGTFFQATQPVSAAALPLPTNAAQETGGHLASIDTKLTSPLSVAQSGVWATGRTWTLSSGSDSVNVGNFPATQAVTQSGTWTVQQGTPPWSQNLTQVGGSSISLGQALATNSFPVVTQSDSAPATQNVTVQDTASTTTAVANAQNFITGSPTASSAASFALSSFESVEVLVTGTWTGTIQTEVSQDGGTTWTTRGVKQSGAAYLASSFTQNFQGGMNFGGMTNVRVRAVAVMTGTATVKINASINPSSIVVSNPQMLRDSTTQSISNTIKAASTAPIATDTAIVVGLSPNGNQAKDTSVTGLQVTQGSITSGQSGSLMQAAVTTSSPSYSNGQTSPLSLNIRGALRQIQVGGDTAQLIRNSYSSTNVTTAAYVQLVASTTSNINRLWIFDSSGQDFVLAVGAAASEVDQIQISPGGWDAPVDLFIPSGSRISIKAVSATANSGILLITGIK